MMKYTKEDLKKMQSWPLERKIQVTQTRIMEWYMRWNGQVYISFSGGKDSTVLLDLARRVYPNIEAVFVDTGLEYPEIREFVKTKEGVTWLYPIKYSKQKKNNGLGRVLKKLLKRMVIRLLAKRLQTQYITQEENRMDVGLKSLSLIVSMFKSMVLDTTCQNGSIS